MIGRGCKSMRRLISASLDGELSPEDERHLRAHLDNCVECRRTRDAYRANRDLIQRNLPNNSDPPQFVTDEILRKTHEISNSHGLRRLILGSRLRLTMSVVATIAVAIIASAFFLVQTYRAGIPPSVAGFQPSPTQEIDFLKPVTITFTHPMNDASVMKNLKMLPPDARTTFIDGGYYHWDGSSLIIGVGKHGQSRPFTADQDYSIFIMPAAKDANGNPLGGNGWSVSFHTTSATKFASGTPITTPTPSSTNTSIAEVSGTTTATEAGKSKGVAPNPSGAPTSSGVNETGTGTVQSQTNDNTTPPTGTTGANSESGSGNTNGNQGTTAPSNGVQGTQTTTPTSKGTSSPSTGNDASNLNTDGTQSTKSPTSTSTPTATSAATSTPTTPTATPTSQATTTATATSTGATVADATPTGTDDPTSSSTSTGTSTSTSTATQGVGTNAASTSSSSTSRCPAVSPTISMPAAFGSVYWPNTDVCTKLGQPKGDSTNVQTSILTFQRGVLIERMDTKKVYILASNGTSGSYQVVDAPSPSIPTADGTPGPSDNLWIPGGDLGKVWSDNKLQTSIGYATSQAADNSTATPVQAFQNGSMIYSDAGFVYVLYNDTGSTWQVYPDTSGHGALLTPKATMPSPTATVSPTSAP